MLIINTSNVTSCLGKATNGRSMKNHMEDTMMKSTTVDCSATAVIYTTAVAE